MEIVIKTDPNHGQACKGTCEATQDIERALDEAEKRHNVDCFLREQEYRRGRVSGQCDMRERAAKALLPGDPIGAGLVSALPIEGE